jgi:aminopeptidase N/puromycin-sensitive aminopeptidase
MKSRCLSPLFGAVLCVAVFSITPAAAVAQRLSQTAVPSHYTLTLTPDLTAATFSGVESIDLTLAEPSDHITLNAVEIAFQSAIVNADGKQQTATISEDKAREQATFTFPEKLAAGNATLSIAYTGILNNELRGFYLSKTARRNYAVTQFESTDARRAFPSFDEPAFKATYDVTLIVDKGDTAISNSAIESDTAGPAAGKHTLKFFATPKMSTYLVAFLVGDFQCTSGESDGVKIRGCATPDKVALTPYSVDVAKYVLHYYNNYFGIPYPLKKLDLIALPDFEAGAMENFGAITYRETAMLVDPKNSSVDAKREVALVIAHEMAHQWFGDLVTMKWWDNIWLNEGFATWMENMPVAAMHPEWNIDQMVASGEDQTLGLDAAPTTRAIRAKAETRDEIEEMFDGISYGKAGAVLLAVENYLGPETFRQGVHAYLSAHEYSNATAEDFWNAQTATSHKPVDKIMESFVAQPGEPILIFDKPASGKVAVSQKRFFLSPSFTPDPARKWTIPVCFKTGVPGDRSSSTGWKTGADTQKCEVLAPGDNSLKIPAASLFFANAGGKGYYRTAYPPSVYQALVDNVETDLAPAERISLIGDEWAQIRSNKSKVGSYLDLVTALKADQDAEVIDNAIGGVNSIYEKVAGTPEEKAALAAWIRKTFVPEYAKLGPTSASDSPNKVELRAHLFEFLGGNGKDPAVLAQAHEITDKYLADPSSVDPTLGQTAVAVAARNGDAALFEQLQNIAENSTNPEMQEGALRLIPQFEDPALVQRSLEYAASGKVRNQDALFLFALALDSNANRDQAWKYIKIHWDTLKTLVTPELGSSLVGSTGSFCAVEDRDDVMAFFATHKVPAAEQALQHAVEHINGCIELRSLQQANLDQWLAAQPKQ